VPRASVGKPTFTDRWSRSRFHAKVAAAVVAVLVAALPPRFHASTPPSAQSAKPDSHVADALRKGEEALAAGKFAAALEAFRKADQQAAKLSVAALSGMARAYHGLGDYQHEAVACLDALKLVSGDTAMEADLHYNRGVALYSLATQPADPALRVAEAEFRATLQLLSSGAPTHFYLGMTILRQGNRDAEGLQHLETAIAGGLKSPDLELAKRAIDNPRRAGERLAPEFNFVTATGATITNRTLEGKTVLLDFWGTWCGPCLKATPGLVKLYAKFAGPSFEMIGISSDKSIDKSKWTKYVADHQLRWPQYLDLKHTVIAPFHVTAYPTFVVIDREGAVRLRTSGYGPGAIEKLEAAIERVIAQR
jgi:thiol-disulfide isomerase/thioredoxin